VAAADIVQLFNTLDGFTDNQLRMVAAYARDLAQERRTARAMAVRQQRNVPSAKVQTSQKDADRT
jgi:hypothetical protein